LIEVITLAGIAFKLARTWNGTGEAERAIKNRKSASRLYSICNPQALRRAKAINWQSKRGRLEGLPATKTKRPSLSLRAALLRVSAPPIEY
jgi:hypothetical protein